MPLQVDRERASRRLLESDRESSGMQDDPRRGPALFRVMTIRGMEGHDRVVEAFGQSASVLLVDPGPAHASGPSFPERSVLQRASPSHEPGRWKR